MEPPRSRSRSPESEIKLHVSQLPVHIQQAELEAAFRQFGEVGSIRIIRKSASGLPLRDSVYGFVVMHSRAAGQAAIDGLKTYGWNVKFSKKPSELNRRPHFPSLAALQYNNQATMSMIFNTNTSPGAPFDAGVVQRLIEANHPSAGNLPNLHPALAGCYMVREVWIGNISSTTDTRSLYESFLQFGTIEGIEMFNSKGFAFIKFKKIVQATLAYEKGQGLIVDRRPVKVAFADPSRRIDIIGDSLTPDTPGFNPIDYEFFKTLYVGYSNGIVVPPESRLMEVFSQYGTVTGIHIKQGNMNTKPYVFVDFEKGDQAAKARIELYIEDTDGSRRGALGDPHLEISFKNTTKSVNKNGVKNGVRYQDRAMQNRDVKGIAEKLLKNPSSVMPHLQQMSAAIPPVYVPSSLPAVPPPPTAPPTATVTVEDNQPSVIWSGFMTRSKKCKVGIDMALVRGQEDCIPSNVYHLNITHRVSLNEVNKYEILAVVSLEAANDTQAEEFNNYIAYFSTKQRAGYVPLKNVVIYIMPPLPEALTLYPKLANSQLLGAFVNPMKKKEPTDPRKINKS